MNGGEARLHCEIADAVGGFRGDIFRKVRVADAIDIRRLSRRNLGTYALQAHFDICVSDEEGLAAFAVEYDGAGHDPSKDELKNDIAREAGLALFRIDERLLERTCGGMTFLQYLVHLWFMAGEFRRAQELGHIDPSEPFMMSGFLRPHARHIFDSEYDFQAAPLARLRKLLVKAGVIDPPRSQALLGVSHLMLGRRDSSFIAYAGLRFPQKMIYGRAKLDIGTPSLGGLDELPFGWSALADFCEGMALDNSADNAEILLQQGSHAVLEFRDIETEVSGLQQNGYRLLRAGGTSDGLPGIMLADLASRANKGR